MSVCHSCRSRCVSAGTLSHTYSAMVKGVIRRVVGVSGGWRAVRVSVAVLPEVGSCVAASWCHHVGVLTCLSEVPAATQVR